LPVKGDDAAQHQMHTEHFEVRLETLQKIITSKNNITAVGTTTMRTLESLPVLGWRIRHTKTPDLISPIAQWEAYDIPPQEENLLEQLAEYMEHNNLTSLQASTRIMIKSGFKFRVVNRLITNFHQPKSTLLLLVSAFIGEHWHRVYDYALQHDFRFLSYGDSSILFRS
jgi:S-adenosylmethionine:tRNA ribosyltransferase-isomerase